MTIDEAKNEIKNTVRIYLEREGDGYAVPVDRQRPILLIGAPGIGKTAIMSEVAEELGIGFVGYTITHHTRQSAIGLPYITKKIYGGKEYSVTEYTMSEIVASVYDAIEKQGRKNGILFIDEINCVSETLAPAMLELLQHKKFGPHSIPSGWILTAAGNPDEYNKSATELDMVTLDRVKKITVEPDYTAFRKYALARGMHPAVTYFLELEKDSLFKAVRTPSGYEFVTPRGWEDLSYAIREYEKLSIPVTLSLINQYVRTPDTAASFFRSYEVFTRLGSTIYGDSIEKGEITKTDMSSAGFEERFALAEIVTRRIISLAEEAVDGLEAVTVARKDLEECAKCKDGKRKDLFLGKYSASLQTSSDIRKKSVYKSIIGILSDTSPEDALKKSREANRIKGKETALKIDNWLKYLENSLGKKQELTSAVTGMMLSESFVDFLSAFKSEEFYRLNAELFISGEEKLKEKAKEILEKL